MTKVVKNTIIATAAFIAVLLFVLIPLIAMAGYSTVAR